MASDMRRAPRVDDSGNPETPATRDRLLVSCGEVRRLTEAAMQQVAERHPGVHWHGTDPEDAAVRGPGCQEVLMLLAQNAAEAMGGRGRLTLSSAGGLRSAD
jgi:hypothetical protein